MIIAKDTIESIQKYLKEQGEVGALQHHMLLDHALICINNQQYQLKLLAEELLKVYDQWDWETLPLAEDQVGTFMVASRLSKEIMEAGNGH